MLQLKGITKTYKTGDLIQVALNQVSLSFRDKEFVSILGASGSGKTTLLNIIGGLDRYDQGDLIINGTSTCRYKDRDWDTYRNHSVGFVFQSYNLIQHQSVLANVELALTISGVSAKERKERAIQALEQVGLSEHMHKKPSQMSGGQMQRVAIARALINNPDILLADEPTGALDTKTSIQVMNLLKEVAKDRLVIMVTHNPELAEAYSSRIIKLRDGVVLSDSMPVNENEQGVFVPNESTEKKHKASMSFGTALGLSFQNLKTKKGRTILTAFAGSIGIIGIALILSLSAGVNAYIDQIQRDTMSSYPIEIDATTMDLQKAFSTTSYSSNNKKIKKEKNTVYSDDSNIKMSQEVNMTMKENNLKAFKTFVESNRDDLEKYLLEDGIVYSYNTSFDLYAKEPGGKIINTNGSDLYQTTRDDAVYNDQATGVTLDMGQSADSLSGVSAYGEISSADIGENYKVVAGKMPSKYNEVVLITDAKGNIPLEKMYQLGLLPTKEYKDIINGIEDKDYTPEVKAISYDDILKHKLYLLPKCDVCEKQEDGTYLLQSDNKKWIEKKIADAQEISITGILKPVDEESQTLSMIIGYMDEFTEYLIDYTKESEVVKAQLANETKDIFTGRVIDIEESENNLKALGYADKEDPVSIKLYAKNFDSKEKITDIIEEYNEDVSEEDKIVYSDLVQMMISSVTTIVNVISGILIAFVAVSLVVSSLMIGIITYISVLERTKEIGILRAIGASKRNISQVFNAETILIGLGAGMIGVTLSEFVIFIFNLIVRLVRQNDEFAAVLPIPYAFLLILISMGLTLLGGLIPAKKAAKKDPVEALRSE